MRGARTVSSNFDIVGCDFVLWATSYVVRGLKVWPALVGGDRPSRRRPSHMLAIVRLETLASNVRRIGTEAA